MNETTATSSHPLQPEKLLRSMYLINASNGSNTTQTQAQPCCFLISPSSFLSTPLQKSGRRPPLLFGSFRKGPRGPFLFFTLPFIAARLTLARVTPGKAPGMSPAGRVPVVGLRIIEGFRDRRERSVSLAPGPSPPAGEGVMGRDGRSGKTFRGSPMKDLRKARGIRTRTPQQGRGALRRKSRKILQRMHWPGVCWLWEYLEPRPWSCGCESRPRCQATSETDPLAPRKLTPLF